MVNETEYLEQLNGILRDCLTGEKKKHALLIVANDNTQTIAMYSANANDGFVNALLLAAKTHLEIEATYEGEERVRH